MAIVINGSGTVTGISVGGLPDGIVDAGTLATNSVDSAELIDGSIDTAHIGTDQITAAIMPTGSIVQVVSSAKTDTFSGAQSSNSQSGTDVTGLTPSITPSSSSNKVLVLVNLNISCDVASGTGDTDLGFSLYRGATKIGSGTVVGNRQGVSGIQHHTNLEGSQSISQVFLDSPSTTSATTYSVKPFYGGGGTQTVYINSTGNDGDSVSRTRTCSSLTVMEVVG